MTDALSGCPKILLKSCIDSKNILKHNTSSLRKKLAFRNAISQYKNTTTKGI